MWSASSNHSLAHGEWQPISQLQQSPAPRARVGTQEERRVGELIKRQYIMAIPCRAAWPSEFEVAPPERRSGQVAKLAAAVLRLRGTQKAARRHQLTL